MLVLNIKHDFMDSFGENNVYPFVAIFVYFAKVILPLPFGSIKLAIVLPSSLWLAQSRTVHHLQPLRIH